MKKINIIELEHISGGVLKCGWVGVLAVASIGSGLLGIAVGAAFGLHEDVIRCWNS